jgi:hypothetical protein
MQVHELPADCWAEVTSTEPHGTNRKKRAASIAFGALCGFVWAVVARLWMRFISTEPEFSWAGTGYIVLIPTVIGLCMGIVHSSPQPKLSRAFGVGSAVFLGMGGGIIMLPTVLFGAIAIGKSRWPWWLRSFVSLIAIIPAAAVLLDDSLDGLLTRATAFVVYAGLCFTMAKMVSVSVSLSTVDYKPAIDLMGEEALAAGRV